MIEVKGLPSYIKSPEVKEILSRHINQMLRVSTVFIGALTEQGQKIGFWKKKEQKKLRKNLCSKRIQSDKERQEIILSVLRKLYSPELETLDIEEKFVLLKACNAAIENEEKVISTLIQQDDLQLENWMWGRYMIEDTDERRKVQKHLKKMKVGAKQYPKEILETKPVNERERILDVIGQTNMLVFEYPTAINFVFDRQEYELLAGVMVSENN